MEQRHNNDPQILQALIVERLDRITQQLRELLAKVEEVYTNGIRRDQAIAELRHEVATVKLKTAEIEPKVEFMFPWVHGLKWFAVIAGGVLALAIVGGILWAMAQSGGMLP